MAETPAMPLPLDPAEQPILEKLILIRDELTLLKQDRSSYVKSSDVMNLYEKVHDQVRDLTELRTAKPHEQNQLDRVLDQCFQLLSLFFMTIGRNDEAPAAYALTSTIKRLLDHLTEAGLYTAKDLDHIGHTLTTLRNIVEKAEGQYSPKLVQLLINRVNLCQELCDNLHNRLLQLGEPLPEIHTRLISILRSMSLANTRSKFSTSEVKKYQDQLKEIESQKVDGKFLNSNGEEAAGSDKMSDLLSRCIQWSDMVLERKGAIPEGFKDTFSTLVSIRNALEKLSLTHSWSLREADLYDYQRQLDRIDEARVDGNFIDKDGQPAELFVQRTLLYLIRRSYAYIFHLMVSSEPVSEALLPIYNQLQTLRRCLIEVKNSGGVSSPRELYPYSMKLNSIDNMRTDGKFIISGDIPDGQGSVNDLLAECFELSYELRVAAESETE